MRLSSMSAALGRPSVAPDSARVAPLLLDCSLSLINRTGAHYIAHELATHFAEHVTVRRWRALGRPLPHGIGRKLRGRLMLKELAHLTDLAALPWPEPDVPDLKRVFLDPLYVLRSRFSQRDVVLCHDIGPISHPELYDSETTRLYAAAYARIRAVAPGMVFVSQASQRAFEARFGTGFRFSHVIPLYVRDGVCAGAERSVPGVRAPFFLTVGALERRKNQVAAMRAFAASGLHDEGYTYVLCGATGSGGGEALALAARTPGVTVLGYVDDAQLRYLYQRATAFVLPSLLEGFGMPALEAAQYGLIPILSRDSALSEAVGGVCVSTHADDVVELADAMREVAGFDDDKRAGMRRALIRQAALASRARFLGAWEALIHDEGRLASTSAPPAYRERFEERSG